VTESEPSKHEPKKHTSPSGKYTATVTSVETRPGCWNTLAIEVEGGPAPVHLTHSYSRWPFLFIEGHPNGHDYLVGGGKSYQGQVAVELDTGRIFEAMSPGSDKGHGFCWAGIQFDPAAQILVVNGCIWAHPYEYRVFDFANPETGWPRIGEAVYIDADGPIEPTFDGNRITITSTMEVESLEERELTVEGFETVEITEGWNEGKYVVLGRETFERRGTELVSVEKHEPAVWTAYLIEQRRRREAYLEQQKREQEARS
jgi:hypothetical protein